MASLQDQINKLQFEIERRAQLFTPNTTMDDANESPLGFNDNPNNAIDGNSIGETLLVSLAVGARYQESNGTQWYKKSNNPVLWEQFGAGSTGVAGEVATKTTSETVLVNDGNNSPVPPFYNPIEYDQWDWEQFEESPIQQFMNFSTIANAIKYANNYKWTEGATLTIEIDETFTVEEQLEFYYGDYSYIILTSDNENGIELNTTGWSVPNNTTTYKPFIYGHSSYIPKINTKIRREISIESDIVCLYLEDHCVVNTFTDMEIANFDVAIVAKNSILNINGIDINTCNKAIIAENCIIETNDATFYDIFDGDTLTLTNSTSSALRTKFEGSNGQSAEPVTITVNGGYLNMTEASIDQSNDIDVSNGGTIVMNNITDTTPAPITKDDLALSQTPNIIRSEGIIYSNLWNNGTIEYSPDTPQETWNIIHNLGKYPSITIIDSDNNHAFAKISYSNLNQVTLEFSEAVDGVAYLN